VLAFIERLEIYHYGIILAWAITLFSNIKGAKGFPYLFEFLTLYLILDRGVAEYFAFKYRYNLHVYSLISTLCAAYYIYIMTDYFRKKSWFKYLLFIDILWLVIALIVVINNIVNRKFDVTGYNLGMVITIVLIFKYFYNLVYIDEYRNIFKESMFYFTLGIMVFYGASFPMMVFVFQFVVENKFGSNNLFNDMIQLGNLILSLGYIGAALCKQTTYQK